MDIKKMTLLCAFFLLAGTCLSLAEEISLKTILPRQDELRVSRGAIGNPAMSTWDYETVDLDTLGSSGLLRVGHAIWIGDNPTGGFAVNPELYIKEDNDRADNTHPRIQMTSRSDVSFILEMDSQAGPEQLHWYFPAAAAEPSDGMFMSVSADQEIRFLSNVSILKSSAIGDPVARLGIGISPPTRDLEVIGDTKTNTLILTPINPTTITTTLVDGMILSDSTDGNRLKQYSVSSSSWNSPAAEATVTGSYTGNNASNRLITLGFQPKYLVIIADCPSNDGKFTKSSSMAGNTAYAEGFGSSDVYRSCNIVFRTTGFSVDNNTIGGVAERNPNRTGQTYYYIAYR